MNNDIRNLSKWLNEEQETPIDRQALARVLAMAEQPAQACDYCNHPQYAGTKCKNCGREQPAQQEHFDHKAAANAALRDAQNRSYQVAKSTQPAQRKPLTDEEIVAMSNDFEEGCVFLYRSFARAIEAAHGIKGDA